MPIVDDRRLIEQIKSGKQQENDQAFRHLYMHCFNVIHKSILSNNGDEQDAEDIFQDGLIVLYHQIKKDKLELTCSIQTYLYSICRNLWLKKLRKSARVVNLTDTLEQYVPIEESHLKTLEDNEHRRIIAGFIDQLSEGCSEILRYFYFEKIRMSKIAEMMGLSNEQVAKNKKSSCMKKLKVLMHHSPYFK